MSKRLLPIEDCGTVTIVMLSPMRFWLNWAIVTLPLAGCIAIWVRSHWAQDVFQRTAYHSVFQIGWRQGSVEIIFMRDSDWEARDGHWSYNSLEVGQPWEPLTQPRFLGFGIESFPGPKPSLKATIIEVPIAFLTLLAAIPPVWSYRNRRKRRKTGFPIEPASAQDDTPKANASSLR